MLNSQHFDLTIIQERLAEKAHQLTDPVERDTFLKIAIQLGQELEKVVSEPEPEMLKYFESK